MREFPKMKEFVICPHCQGARFTAPPENIFATIGMVGADPHVVTKENGTTCPEVTIQHQSCFVCHRKGYLEIESEKVSEEVK